MADRKEYYKEYAKRPEVKERKKKYLKKYLKEYRKRPEVIEKNKQYIQTQKYKNRIKEYEQRPKTKKLRKDYRQKPEIKKLIKEYYKVYNQKPGVKKKRKIWDEKYQKEYLQKSEVKKRIKEYYKIYRQKIEYKIRKKEINQKPINKIRKRIIRRILDIAKSTKSLNINYSAIIQHLQPFPQDLDLRVIHHKIPLNRFKFFNPDGTIIKEDFEKAFAPDNHEWMLVEEHRKLDHSKL